MFLPNLSGLFNRSIDDVIGMTHRVWPQKSKIQTQQLILTKQELKVRAFSWWNRRSEKKSEIHRNLKIVTVSLTPKYQSRRNHEIDILFRCNGTINFIQCNYTCRIGNGDLRIAISKNWYRNATIFILKFGSLLKVPSNCS